MNKKYAIACIVLIALMCGSVFSMAVKGWQSPSPPYGPSDKTFLEYGPRADVLWVNNYGSYLGEYNEMASKTIDFMDTTLLPSDYNTLQGLGGYVFSEIVQLGIDEVDFNGYFLPFNTTAYRQAFMNILNVHKVDFVATLLGSAGAPAYTPIPGCITENSGYPWYDYDGCVGINNGGYSKALQLLCALAEEPSTSFPLAVDQVEGGGAWATWNFSAPYPISGNGLSYNPYVAASPWGETGEGGFAYGTGADWGVDILCRTTDQRVDMGPEVQKMLGANFTWWYEHKASDADKTLWTDTLADFGLSDTLLPAISVIIHNIDPPSAWDWVMSEYCYEMYTAGYSYGFTPDSMLSNYKTSSSPQANMWGWFWDETLYSNADYDSYEALMESSATIGTAPSPAPGTGLYYAYLAQENLAQNAVIFPYWTFVGYSPQLNSTWRDISMPGTGFNNWWTILNAYPTAGSPGVADNALIYGLRGAVQKLCNPINSNSYYDWQIIPEIYDTLLVSNPYNLSDLLPYIADSWSSGTWFNPNMGESDTVITFHIRNDVWWQDVPSGARTAVTLDNGTELNGPLTNRLMTALDVAFSMIYAGVGYGYSFVQVGGGLTQVDHVVIGQNYQSTWDGLMAPYPGNSTVCGLPFLNETYIMKTLGVGPSDFAWPYYQWYLPPSYPAYYTTPQYIENYVQFDKALDSYTIKVYMSVLAPWLGIYRVGSTFIFPMDIFSHIGMGGGWYTIDKQGQSWKVKSVQSLNLQPASYGGNPVDLEYGSGPFILVTDTGTGPNNYKLIAFKAGNTYGDITLQHSYFWYCPVREADTKTSGDPELFYLKMGALTNPNGRAAWIGFTLTNYDAFNAMTFTFTPTLSIWWYVSGAWIFGGLQTYPAGPQTLTLAAGQTKTWWFGFGPIAVPGGATWMKPDKEYTIEITTGPTYAIGRTSAGYGLFTNHDTRYAQGICMCNMHRLSADIGSAAATSPYYASDGTVGPPDLGILSAQWKKTVSWALGIDPTDNLHKADINADGTVGPPDLGFVSAQWKQTWDTVVGGLWATQPPLDP